MSSHVSLSAARALNFSVQSTTVSVKFVRGTNSTESNTRVTASNMRVSQFEFCLSSSMFAFISFTLWESKIVPVDGLYSRACFHGGCLYSP